MTTGPRALTELSRREARRAHLAAQGLLGRRLSGPGEVLTRTRGVQLDTISVLARAHELMAFARLGALPRARIENAYWGGPPYEAMEYWYHAACIVPIEEWPNFAWKREAIRHRGFRWHRLADPEASCKEVIGQLQERGPLTANELGGAKRGGVWWDWSDTKIAVEWLLDIGEVVCTTRRSFQRVYDLPERAVPGDLLARSVDKDTAVATLVQRACAALGVASAADIARYAGLKRPETVKALAEGVLEEVRIEGWETQAYAAPGSLEHPAVSGRAGSRTVLLSPFDGVVCDRDRLDRLFGFRHRLEAYVPKPKRVHGYYAMPVLAGDSLVGRVDPARVGTTLVARSVHLEPATSESALARSSRHTARALIEAARWVGCDSVALERVEPARARSHIAAAL